MQLEVTPDNANGTSEKSENAVTLEPIRVGSLEVVLASSPEEIERAQKLRYQVFFEEMGGKPSEEVRKQERDFDEFDRYCDHLLVLEHDPAQGGPKRVVGTYRLLRGKAMRKLGRFYTESEFDISPLLDRTEGDVLELGRSCVDKDYRRRAVVQLLWRGIGQYVAAHDVRTLFGCGSLFGADPESHRVALSYLYHHHLAPEHIRVRAIDERYVEMNLIPKDQIDAREAFNALPALVKGYLRAGGYVGEGAVVDAQCNTTDIAIIVTLERVKDKYVQRYTAPKDQVS